ncbi:MAG: hypothetical protein WDZ59_02265 [Pirellulales bacterium]
MAWILPWFYVLFVGGWTYRCTRGSDGELVDTFVGFGIFGIVYWLTVYWQRPVKPHAVLWHFVAFELAAVVALVVNPQLDEMGGMLNTIIPMLIAIIAIGGFILACLLPAPKINDRRP